MAICGHLIYPRTSPTRHPKVSNTLPVRSGRRARSGRTCHRADTVARRVRGQGRRAGGTGRTGDQRPPDRAQPSAIRRIAMHRQGSRSGRTPTASRRRGPRNRRGVSLGPAKGVIDRAVPDGYGSEDSHASRRPCTRVVGRGRGEDSGAWADLTSAPVAPEKRWVTRPRGRVARHRCTAIRLGRPFGRSAEPS